MDLLCRVMAQIKVMAPTPMGTHGSPRCSSAHPEQPQSLSVLTKPVTSLHWAYLKEKELLLRLKDQISASAGWIWSLEHRGSSLGSNQLLVHCERLTDILAFLLYLQYFNPASKGVL